MKENHKIQPIGARILKSALGAAICMAAYFLREQNGMPFYSVLAVLWCMQPYTETTLSMAKQRSIGTLIGAAFGLAFLLIERMFSEPNTAAVYFFASAAIIPIIYLTVLLNKRNASFFSCVVFLSITITHSFDAEPYLFVLNRVIDTFIGILIGVILNVPLFGRKHDNSVLYVSGIDEVLVDGSNTMIPYNKVELNRLIANGAMFTVSTIETPATLMSLMDGVKLRLPVIAMDGAVLYDISENRFLERIPLDKETALQCEEIIAGAGLHCFVNALCDDTLLIYYGEFGSSEERSLFEKLRRSPHRNYIKKEHRTEHSEVIYLFLLAETEKITNLSNMLQSALGDKIRITVKPSADFGGFSEMHIYSPLSGKAVMLGKLMKLTGASGCITFGSIEGQYDVIVHDDGGNSAVKEFRRLYKKSRANP